MYKLRFLAMIMKQNIGFYIISRLGAGYRYDTGQHAHCDTESYSAEEGYLFFSILGLDHLTDENILNLSSFTQTCLFPGSLHHPLTEAAEPWTDTKRNTWHLAFLFLVQREQ